MLNIAEVKAQCFDFAANEAVRIPAPVELQIRHYIESHDGINLKIFAGQYQYVPVFNVINHSRRQFTDGVYLFTWGSHDSGRLFINRKGKIVILRNGSVADIMTDYTSFLKQHQLPEATQVRYLSAVAAFVQFRYKDQQMLIKSGALMELK
ncbi:hypothetical protein [Hymenobacter siberiensis]|uniref:hypothetical protein n=1 Tax=Hymenobacter siberiensis TaxID=2848396 RepID=UPI001C1E03F0|nr:hypothetical protein [Hymenobacter siberiensis]MBU6119326.1 hypothetical protein [Hymenobacter siberiensis]